MKQHNNEPAHKVIIDTDPGIDDAMAIFTAMAHDAIELLGLTTVFGNASIEDTTRNALQLVEMSGLDIPVAQGAAVPIEQEPHPYPDFVHGKNGMADLDLAPPQRQPIKQGAADFIIEQVNAQPGEITLIPIGPLTNLALALERAPDIAQKVKQVVLMGGTILENGNVSPVAEANIFSDPHSADKVMTAEWPVTVVGLDVTHQVLLSRELFADIAAKNPRVGDFMQQAAAFYIDFYEREREASDGCFGHDVSAVAYVVQPDLFTTISGEIRVATDGPASGQTIMDRKPWRSYALPYWEQQPKQKACMQVDAEALVELFHNSMTHDCWQS
ncbi:MAG: nucleoside hydrolase [Thiolinea sp.]